MRATINIAQSQPFEVYQPNNPNVNKLALGLFNNSVSSIINLYLCKLNLRFET